METELIEDYEDQLAELKNDFGRAMRFVELMGATECPKCEEFKVGIKCDRCGHEEVLE